MGRHKDGRLEPRSKAQHDRPAFEKYKKARQDMHPRISQQEQAVAGDPLELLGVLHNIERVVMVAVPLLMMMRLKITELSTGRGRAPTKSQMMMTVLMLSKRLRRRRRRHLQFRTHLKEDYQLTASTLVCLTYITL
jgi:hypothetical protein